MVGVAQNNQLGYYSVDY